jgi:endoglucanase
MSYIKNVSFLLTAVSFCLMATGQKAPAIELNQLGFYPKAPKIAVVVSNDSINQFYVLSATQKDTVFRGKLSRQRNSQNSSLKTQLADFSELSTPGRFILVAAGADASTEFSIKPGIHLDLAKASLKGFYFQRVSMPLTSEHAGQWARPAGHPDNQVLVHPSAAGTGRPAGTIIPSPGGWYDAGDYNKYIVNSGITMGTLMSAYEDFHTYFDTLRTNIPESGNAIPDLLDEVLYNLRWMLTMQDPNDGGVYHKCTNAAFDGTVMPGITKLPRYVVQKSTAATLDFAAVMAQAARVYKKFNRQLPGLGDSCIKAARLAWDWAIKNPGILYRQDSINQVHEPKITTGAYGDRNLNDEWFWAASELFSTSGSEQYKQKLVSYLDTPLSIPTWSQVHLLGVYTLVRNKNQKSALNKFQVQQLETELVNLAEYYLAQVRFNAFLTVMGGKKTDFNWGSNSNAANQGVLMFSAWRVSPETKFINAALSNLDYLCGRNATGYSFITGFGKRSTRKPHHRPSEADGIDEPVPGLLAGGPNPGMQDKCNYPFREPETAYIDDYCSYASNEIAINWNAPLVYLANAIEALSIKAGYNQ